MSKRKGQGFAKTNLPQALEIFQLDNHARNLAISTLRYYRLTLTPFIEWCEAKQVTLLADVTATHIRTYLAEAADRKLASHTLHKMARSLRTFFNFCTREGLLKNSPMINVKMPKTETKLPTSFTDDEIRTILLTCDSARDTTICMLLLDSGMRAGELAALNVGDIDLVGGIVTIQRGKGGKERVSYFGWKTKKQLALYIAKRGQPEDHEPLFLSENKSDRLSIDGLFHFMTRLRKQTGIKHCSAHTFRRTAATSMLRSGASVAHVARLLGHSSTRTLNYYIGLLDADIQKAHADHGVVNHLTKGDKR